MTDLNDDLLDAIVKAHRRSYGRSDACVCGEAYPCSSVGLVVEVKRLRAEVVRLSDGIRKLALTIEAFGVERTEWEYSTVWSVVSGQAPGFAVPDDCDAANVVIDSDVYEAVLDLVALLDVAGDDALDEIVRVSEDAGLYDDPVPYRALEGSEGGEDD